MAKEGRLGDTDKERVRHPNEIPMRVSLLWSARYAHVLEASLRQAPRRYASEGRSDGVTCENENCSTR